MAELNQNASNTILSPETLKLGYDKKLGGAKQESFDELIERRHVANLFLVLPKLMFLFHNRQGFRFYQYFFRYFP